MVRLRAKFSAEVVSDNRITIPKALVESLKICKGDIVVMVLDEVVKTGTIKAEVIP